MVLFIIFVVAVLGIALIIHNNKTKISETIEKVESTIAPTIKEVKEVVAKAEAEIAKTKAPTAKKPTSKTNKK
jgi:uncharacterized protein YoxC